jgi:hypothetical protein
MKAVTKDRVKMLKALAKELENNGKLFSADEQATIRSAARSVEATVDRNLAIRLYSHNEDD